MKNWFTPENRLYLYGVVSAAIPLLIGLGLMTEGLAQQVVFLVAAILGVSAPRLSAKNVDTTSQNASVAPVGDQVQ